MSKYILVLSTLLLVLTGCSKSIDVQLDAEVMVFLSNAAQKKYH